MQKVKSNPMEVAAACGAETVAAVDRTGYQFLASNGYPEVLEKGYGPTVRDAVRKKMSKRGEKLYTHSKWDAELGQYIIWFSLRRGKKVLATSSPVRLQGKPLEGLYDAKG